MPKYLKTSFLAAIAFAVALSVATSSAIAQRAISGNARLEVELTEGVLIRLPEPVDAVFVANPTIADLSLKSSTLVYIRGNAAGTTNLFAVNADDEIIADIDIVVTHNISQLNRAIAAAAPGSQVEALSVGKNVILTGTALSARQAQNAMELATGLVQDSDDQGVIINQMRVTGPNQVNLRVRIAEISRSVTKNLSLQFDVLTNFLGGQSIDLLTGAALIGAVVEAGGQLEGEFDVTDEVDIDTALRALEENGLASILAEPNLTTLSGETASFLAGGDVPIPVPQEDGVITIEFRQFGVALSFTPTILDSGHISLRVRPEVSSVNFADAAVIQGFPVPNFNTRRTETTVELGSGQSMAIAGLLQDDVTEQISKVPGFGDLPILGALFRSSQFERAETELVIIVTPYLVQPISTVAAADPVNGFTPPSDYQRTVEGRLNVERPRGGAPSPVNRNAQGLVGPVGFVLD